MRMLLLLAVVLTTLAGRGRGGGRAPPPTIYPEGHWTRSTSLTVDTFDAFIQTNVDAGKTVFAPAWNQATQTFASNNDVVFGDVNLSKDPVRGNHNPGKGGWPSVKYFNQETGYEGRHYQKKTNKKICDELGDFSYMKAFVEEAGNVQASATGDRVEL